MQSFKIGLNINANIGFITSYRDYIVTPIERHEFMILILSRPVDSDSFLTVTKCHNMLTRSVYNIW